MKKQKQKNRRNSIIIMVLLFIMGVSVVLYATEPETTNVVCADINLFDALVKDLDDYVYRSDRNTKTIRIVKTDIPLIKELKLTGSSNKIKDLTGMEAFTSLESLNLSGNSITNVEPISNLTTLKTLNISGNETTITNLDTLSNLVNLTNVNFSSSKLSNVDFMSTYYKLQVLDVSSNSIISLDALRGLSNLQELNISNNSGFNRFQTNISCHTNLKVLDISSTAVQSLEYIEELINLEKLYLRYMDIDLSPIVETYKIEGTSENRAYLENLKVLDISHTNQTVTFKKLSYLKNLTHLYMINVVGTSNSKLSLAGIYELQDLQYVNLAENNISSLEGIYYEKKQGEEIVETKCIGATEIYLQNNNISDLELLTKLKKTIKILNLAYNNISDVSHLYGCNFASNLEVNLQYQDISLNIFQKTSVDQYIILPNIFQESKKQGSMVYSNDTDFLIKCNGQVDEESIRLNKEEPYLQPNYYNVIINKSKVKEDVLTLEITGNSIAKGSKITFKLGTSTSNVDSIVFKDQNLFAAINNHFLLEENIDKVKYLENAHLIMNINNSAIKATDGLQLSGKNIFDLSGMENFTGLTNLNISGNKLTTIDQLQYCTKMLNLEVANNNIGDNNTAITYMTKIQQLDLSNTNMTNVNSINTLIDTWANTKKFPLTKLIISGNGFTDKQLERIQEINSLSMLNISANKINEVKSFANLAGSLTNFDASQNEIADIDILGTFINLTSLNLSNNKIKDISAISSCTKLIDLNLSANIIEDVSPLRNIAASGTLIILNINNNKIKDVSAVDRPQINQLLSAESQKITQVISDEAKGIITVQLPQIYVAAKNSSSQFYDNGEGVKITVVGKEDGIETTQYCSLSSDGTSVSVNTDIITDENIIVVKIQDGKADNTTLSIAAPLKGTITYNPSNENPTNQDVTATIAFNRTATILNNDGKNTYKFTQNGEFTFEFTDEYGFEGTAIAKVTNIDKVAPQVSVIKEIVNQKIVVTVSANESIRQTEGWTLSTNKLKMTKTYSNDANETVKVIDEAGNVSQINIKVKMDRTSPTITGIENEGRYSRPVKPIVEDEHIEKIELVKDAGEAVIFQSGTEISESGEYVLTATDKFGNKTVIVFVIELSDEITSKNTSITVTEDDTMPIIRGITPNTLVSELAQNLEAVMTFKILDKNGNEVANTEKIGTGYQIKMQNGKLYTLIVWGDLNGDAKISISELAAASRVATNPDMQITEIQLLAMDVSKDGKIKIPDLAVLSRLKNEG